MNPRPAHADELGVSLLRLGTLRVTLTDFTESLTDSDHLWDRLDPMTKTRALQIHDLVNLIGDDLDVLRSLINHPASRATGPVIDCHDDDRDDGDDVVEFGRGTL